MAGVGTAIAGIATTVGTLIVNLFQSLTGIFWNAAANEGQGELTIFGYLLLFSAIIALGLLIVGWIRRLMHVGKSS